MIATARWPVLTTLNTISPQPGPSAHQQGDAQVCTLRSSVARSTGYGDPSRVAYIFGVVLRDNLDEKSGGNLSVKRRPVAS